MLFSRARSPVSDVPRQTRNVWIDGGGAAGNPRGKERLVYQRGLGSRPHGGIIPNKYSKLSVPDGVDTVPPEAALR
jgi:hypothetical protein